MAKKQRTGWAVFGPNTRNTGSLGMGGGAPGSGQDKESKQLGFEGKVKKGRGKGRTGIVKSKPRSKPGK